MFEIRTASLLEKLHIRQAQEQKVSLWVLRLDKIDALVSGNKWFKLKYNIIEAQNQKKNTLLTFGGAYSNHILATAAVGKHFGFETIGIIRGEEHRPLNAYLQKAQNLGMHLYYVDRAAYRKKTETAFLENLKERWGDFYLLPEGGSNALAVRGTAEILNFLTEKTFSPTHICTCVGTGGTLAGLAASLQGMEVALLGFPVLKNARFLYEEIENLLVKAHISDFHSFKLHLEYHFGGYAKTSPLLLDFMKEFSEKCPLEPVYSAKMFFGIIDLLQKGYFPAGSTILALHNGGLFLREQPA